MVKKIFVAAVALIMSMLCGCGESFYGDLPAFEYYTQCNKEVFATGITFRAAVRGGNEQEAINRMLALMDDINSEMSVTLSGSAIARFNSSGENERVEISQSAYNLIARTLEFYRDTMGAFNIAVLPLAKLWHADTAGLNEYAMCDPADGPGLPEYSEAADTATHCNPENIILSEEDGKYYISKTDPYIKIDLGAVAKGYAADECIKIASACGVESALINISGNICVLGEWYHPSKKKYVRWEIGVTAPRPFGGLGGDMCALSVPADKTLVTSGDYVRYYRTLYGENAITVPHIISSETGLPLGIEYSDGKYAASNSHIISATLVCADSTMADAYATAVCLMDADTAVGFLRAKKINGLLVTADNRMIAVGITESSGDGEEYFIYKDSISAYKKYSLEEYTVE